MINSTMVSIWENSSPRRTVFIVGSTLTKSVVISHTHHSTQKMAIVLRMLCVVGSSETSCENTMIAATMTKS